MKKVAGLFVAAALFATAPIFAESKNDQSCCAATGSAGVHKMGGDFASLGVTKDQKKQLQKWQKDCEKGGCTKESREAFMSKAKGILTSEQYAKLKAECESPSQKTQS